jgi:1-acyl-sn-glycerol-3-phosphate acyltransferase
VLLKVATNEVRVNTSSGKTTIKLNPSGATVVIAPEGTTFTGVKADQIEIQWQTTPSTTK